MLREFMNQNLFLLGMLAAGVLSAWCVFWTSRFYDRAIRDFRRLPDPRSKWMKEMLEQISNRKEKLRNPEVFIHMRMMSGKTFGIYLHQIKRAYGYMIGVCLLFLLAGLYTAIVYQAPLFVMYQHIAAAGIVIFGSLLLRQIFGLGGKEEMVLEGWMDYLENETALTVGKRTVESGEEMEKMIVKPAAHSEEEEERIACVEAGIRQTAAAESKFSHLLTPEEEDVMREVIREYLT